MGLIAAVAGSLAESSVCVASHSTEAEMAAGDESHSD